VTGLEDVPPPEPEPPEVVLDEAQPASTTTAAHAPAERLIVRNFMIVLLCQAGVCQFIRPT
jgi:hypothetical protein